MVKAAEVAQTSWKDKKEQRAGLDRFHAVLRGHMCTLNSLAAMPVGDDACKRIVDENETWMNTNGACVAVVNSDSIVSETEANWSLKAFSAEMAAELREFKTKRNNVREELLRAIALYFSYAMQLSASTNAALKDQMHMLKVCNKNICVV